MLLRGQALLLLLVGILVGAVLAAILMTREGLPAPLAARIADLVAPPHSGLPTSIEVGSSPDRATAGLRRTLPVTKSPSPAAPSHAGRPTPAAGQVTVVPPPVYTYYDHGHGGGDDSGSSGHHR